MAHAGALLLRAPGAVAVTCDLDHFKSINDRFGHAAGDEVIRTFGQCIGNHVEGALSGRIGGEEFCLLLAGATPEFIAAALSKIRTRLRQARYDRLPAEIIVTASFGVARRLPDERLDDLLHRADMALYAAKAAGRDCYRFAEDRPEPSAPMPA